MKRRKGFTLIEVLAALAIVTIMLVAGIGAGRMVVQREREAVFMRRVRTEWRNTVTAAREHNWVGRMAWKQRAHAVTFEYRGAAQRVTLPIPNTLSSERDFKVEQADNGFFATPRKYRILTPFGQPYVLAFEMGWGELYIRRGE